MNKHLLYLLVGLIPLSIIALGVFFVPWLVIGVTLLAGTYVLGMGFVEDWQKYRPRKQHS